jgi:4-hydroxybenzoate polyprenyltransferase
MDGTTNNLAIAGVADRSLPLGMLRLMRPKDWIKNVFVFIPLPFAWVAARNGTAAFDWDWTRFAVGVAGFCLLNSTIYILNDWFDAKADRLHPRKCKRPIAAGIVATPIALVQMAVLAILGTALVAATGKTAAIAVAVAYVLINVIYSSGAKHVALLDVFLLSSGFALRVLLGVALVGSAPSSWLLLCTSALALFLGFTKRRGDLVAGLDHKHRPSLRGYTVSFLNHAMLICAGVALLAYALYSIEAKVFAAGREMASLPFVAYGILNYLRLAETENAGDSPVEMAYRSRSSQICAVGWLAAVLWSLGIW